MVRICLCCEGGRLISHGDARRNVVFLRDREFGAGRVEGRLIVCLSTTDVAVTTRPARCRR